MTMITKSASTILISDVFTWTPYDSSLTHVSHPGIGRTPTNLAWEIPQPGATRTCRADTMADGQATMWRFVTVVSNSLAAFMCPKLLPLGAGCSVFTGST